MEGPGADSEEKRVLASDLDTVMVDSLKALDLSRPIREADMGVALNDVRFRGCKRTSLGRAAMSANDNGRRAAADS